MAGQGGCWRSVGSRRDWPCCRPRVKCNVTVRLIHGWKASQREELEALIICPLETLSPPTRCLSGRSSSMISLADGTNTKARSVHPFRTCLYIHVHLSVGYIFFWPRLVGGNNAKNRPDVGGRQRGVANAPNVASPLRSFSSIDHAP